MKNKTLDKIVRVTAMGTTLAILSLGSIGCVSLPPPRPIGEGDKIRVCVESHQECKTEDRYEPFAKGEQYGPGMDDISQGSYHYVGSEEKCETVCDRYETYTLRK